MMTRGRNMWRARRHWHHYALPVTDVRELFARRAKLVAEAQGLEGNRRELAREWLLRIGRLLNGANRGSEADATLARSDMDALAARLRGWGCNV